jgi:hypothetical protein
MANWQKGYVHFSKYPGPDQFAEVGHQEATLVLLAGIIQLQV